MLTMEPSIPMTQPDVCSFSVASRQAYKFTGKERDSETGLDYFGARYYGSNMGRWMSPDWAASATAVPYADFGNPQSLNLYSYVGNNPLSRADADGHCFPFCDIVMRVVQYIATHAAATGTGIQSTRQEYVQRAKGATSAAERDALKVEMRGKGPALGRELANQAANDPARVAARAAKTDAQLAESVARTNPGATGMAGTAGTIGKVAGAAAVGIAVYDVATAPEGQKLETAGREGSGLAGAWAGGELGAEAGAFFGPWGAGIGGVAGAIGGGFFGTSIFNSATNPRPNPQPDQKPPDPPPCTTKSIC
jgi:RHS repeat-associated protein